MHTAARVAVTGRGDQRDEAGQAGRFCRWRHWRWRWAALAGVAAAKPASRPKSKPAGKAEGRGGGRTRHHLRDRRQGDGRLPGRKRGLRRPEVHAAVRIHPAATWRWRRRPAARSSSRGPPRSSATSPTASRTRPSAPAARPVPRPPGAVFVLAARRRRLAGTRRPRRPLAAAAEQHDPRPGAQQGDRDALQRRRHPRPELRRTAAWSSATSASSAPSAAGGPYLGASVGLRDVTVDAAEPTGVDRRLRHRTRHAKRRTAELGRVRRPTHRIAERSTRASAKAGIRKIVDLHQASASSLTRPVGWLALGQPKDRPPQRADRARRKRQPRPELRLLRLPHPRRLRRTGGGDRALGQDPAARSAGSQPLLQDR